MILGILANVGCVAGLSAMCVLGAVAISNGSHGVPSPAALNRSVIVAEDMAANCEGKWLSPLLNDERRLALAYISVENLARPGWRRKVEIEIAHIAWLVEVPSPAKTLGIGQIAQQTFEHENLQSWLSDQLGQELEQKPFWFLMSDDCVGLLSVYGLVRNFWIAKHSAWNLSDLVNYLHGRGVYHNLESIQSRLIYEVLFRKAVLLLANREKSFWRGSK